MPVITLNDMTVRSLKPGLYLDQKTPSFGIRIGKNRKTWLIIRPDRAKQKFGAYPSLSPSDARAEARRLLTTEPARKPATLPFEKARDLFLEDNYKDAKPRTKNEATRLLKKHFKKLNKTNIGAITDEDIQDRLDSLASTPSEQLHSYRVIRCFFNWCSRPPRKFIKQSPMHGYQPPGKDRKGTRTLTDDELKAVWNAAAAPPHNIVRLLILWGTRNSETAAARRDWNKGDILTIPGAFTKNGRDHSIPVLPLTRQVLDSSRKSGDYYFGSRWGGGHLTDGAWGKLKREIQAASGTKDWQLRDLRRTFRSNMARLRVPRDLAEILINHAPPTLDEIYDRYDRLEEKRDALWRYEEWLRKLIEN